MKALESAKNEVFESQKYLHLTFLNKCIEPMPKWFEEVKKAKGGATKY